MRGQKRTDTDKEHVKRGKGDTMQILVVEDERRLADALAEILTEAKYMTDVVYDGQEGYEYAREGIYDLIILDVMLPGMDGFKVCRKLREEKIETPVIMLTAKDAVADKITGLDEGADDYMTKPFVAEELLARIRAVTRRKGEVIIDRVEYRDISLNLETCVLSGNAREVRLSHKEFEIMKLLMTNPEATFSKDEIIVKVWGYDSEATDNNVEAYISFLRKKLSHVESEVTIEAIRKMGYRIC